MNAQNCIDTVHIKGYYVIMRIASEIGDKIIRKKNKIIIEQRVDVHREASFIPEDSIFGSRTLAYRINHFFDNTNQVFISCERFSAKYFVDKKCFEKLKLDKDTCLFPSLKSNIFYQTTNINTGDVFKICYLDAYWAKVKVKKESVESSMIPSRIAQVCISPDVTEFDLYCFIRGNEVQMNPPIDDPDIGIWEKK